MKKSDTQINDSNTNFDKYNKRTKKQGKECNEQGKQREEKLKLWRKKVKKKGRVEIMEGYVWYSKRFLIFCDSIRVSNILKVETEGLRADDVLVLLNKAF